MNLEVRVRHRKHIYDIPPSSFTFKMAFWNGTAFILKPTIRKQKTKN